MNEAPLISVIMPVYNTELYVSDAIKSILTQSLGDLELICIDDGSVDQSRAICEEFAANDERITVITQENNGQGYARNRALERARGRFVYYMDSDDILSPTALEELHQEVESKNLDLLFFEAHSFGDNKSMNDYKRTFSYDEVYRGVDLANRLLKNNEFIVSPCLYIASIDLYRDNNIRFLEHVRHEDDIVTILILLNSKRASCAHRDLYARRYRPGSTMMTFNPVASVKGAFRTYCELMRRRKEADISSPLQTSAADAFLNRCVNETVRHFSRCSVSPKDFATLVDCRDRIERQAASDIINAIHNMGFKFYLLRFLRHLKRRVLCVTGR